MTADVGGSWVSLFSGGKDSSWALYRTLERGLPVERLMTVHPEGDSYMYHVPATQLAGLAAESVGIPLVEVEPDDFEAGETVDETGIRSHSSSRERSRRLVQARPRLGRSSDGISPTRIG